LLLTNQEVYTEETFILSAENDLPQREKKAVRDDSKVSGLGERKNSGN